MFESLLLKQADWNFVFNYIAEQNAADKAKI